MMLGAAPRSSRIILKAPVSSGRSGNTRHTRPPLMAASSLPYRAVSESKPCEGSATGGAMLGTARDSCVDGASRLGGGGLDGGARFIDGPDGTFGTAAGGTGGGRSENIWAFAGTIWA